MHPFTAWLPVSSASFTTIATTVVTAVARLHCEIVAKDLLHHNLFTILIDPYISLKTMSEQNRNQFLSRKKVNAYEFDFDFDEDDNEE